MVDWCWLMNRSLTESVAVSENLVSKFYKDEKQGQCQWLKHSRSGESTQGRQFPVALRTPNAKGVSWHHTTCLVELTHKGGQHSAPTHLARQACTRHSMVPGRCASEHVAGCILACCVGTMFQIRVASSEQISRSCPHVVLWITTQNNLWIHQMHSR